VFAPKLAAYERRKRKADRKEMKFIVRFEGFESEPSVASRSAASQSQESPHNPSGLIGVKNPNNFLPQNLQYLTTLTPLVTKSNSTGQIPIPAL
jgi:hypothetical protein